VYVADGNGDRVEKFDSSGAYISQFGSAGSGNGQFAQPYGVAVDPYSEDVYVTDTNGNNRVERFASSGTYLGQVGAAGSGPGEFSIPVGVAVDQSTCDVFVTDIGNHRVEKFGGGPCGGGGGAPTGGPGGGGSTGQLPSPVTGAASDVGHDAANLAGTVDPNGQPTTYRFEYGTTTDYGSSTPTVDAAAGDQPTPVSTRLSGLAAAATYHYRLVATNAAGTSYGGDQSFETLIPGVDLPPNAFTGPDGDQDGIPDKLESLLAHKFAPTLLLDPHEPNYPVSVDWLLQRTTLDYYQSCAYFNAEAPQTTSPRQADLLQPISISSSCSPFLHTFVPLWSADPDPESDLFTYTGAPRTCSTGLPPPLNVVPGSLTTRYPHELWHLTTVQGRDRLGMTDVSQWPTYYHVYPDFHGGVIVQYWHLFSYNDWLTTNPELLLCDAHGGDWDASIQVQLNSKLQVSGAWFSHHSDDAPGEPVGHPREESLAFDGSTAHPVVIVDAGGHAAYASPHDFCAYQKPPGLNNSGRAVWPVGAPASSPGPLSNLTAGALQEFSCDGDVATSSGSRGGVVWRTGDTGPGAVQASGLDNPISGGGRGGPLGNLGEYNPGTNTQCPTAQGGASHRCVGLAPGNGSFHPLDSNVFIGYSGKWADPHDSVLGFGDPPRGPVFQGPSDRGFASWYNQASSDAAAPSWDTWLRAGADAKELRATETRALAGRARVAPGGKVKAGRVTDTALVALTAVGELTSSSTLHASRARKKAKPLARVHLHLRPGAGVALVFRLSTRVRRRLPHVTSATVSLELRLAGHKSALKVSRRLLISR
jgi:hypothetical protein